MQSVLATFHTCGDREGFCPLTATLVLWLNRHILTSGTATDRRASGRHSKTFPFDQRHRFDLMCIQCIIFSGMLCKGYILRVWGGHLSMSTRCKVSVYFCLCSLFRWSARNGWMYFLNGICTMVVSWDKVLWEIQSSPISGWRTFLKKYLDCLFLCVLILLLAKFPIHTYSISKDQDRGTG